MRAHRLLDAFVHDARAAREVAVLGDVGDGIAHVLEAAFVDQVDDQLQLVEAFVVGDLRLVARLDERLEAGLDQRRDAAAEHGLLAEEVALGLLGERRLEEAYATAADRGAVRERKLERLAACVLMDGDEPGCSGARFVELTHAVSGSLRRDHHDVVAGGRDDAAEVDVQAVREQQRSVRREVRLDLRLVDAFLHVIGHEDRHDLGSLRRLADGAHGQTGFLRRITRRAARAQADFDLDAGVTQVEGVCVALAAVADHGDLAGEQVDVSFAVNGCQRELPSCQRTTSWRRLMVDLEDARLRPTRPVRTSSLTP